MKNTDMYAFADQLVGETRDAYLRRTGVTSSTHVLKVKKLHPEAILPQYQTPGAACFDLHAHGADWGLTTLGQGVEVAPGREQSFRTGLAVEVPEGYVLLIFSRSGHGFNNNVRLSNAVGVIDSDYRGELCVKLTADTNGGLRVTNKMRIAQGMLVKIGQWQIEEVDELSSTERGTAGFGSTGN